MVSPGVGGGYTCVFRRVYELNSVKTRVFSGVLTRALEPDYV